MVESMARWMTGAARAAVGVGAACLLMGLSADGARADGATAAFETALETLPASGWEADLEIVSDRSVTIAMAASYQAGVCRVLMFDASPYLAETLRTLDDELRRPYLEALFAHELAHCDDMHEARTHAGREPAGRAALDVEPAPRRDADGDSAAESSHGRVLWAEILADAATVLYLQERHPELADALVAFHLGRRAQRGEIDPGHDTSRFLMDREIRRRSDEDILEAARRVRRTSADDLAARRDGERRVATR